MKHHADLLGAFVVGGFGLQGESKEAGEDLLGGLECRGAVILVVVQKIGREEGFDGFPITLFDGADELGLHTGELLGG